MTAGKPKMVVLLSSGLDSTYNLYRAHEEGEVVLAITFNYQHRAAPKEILRAKALCDYLQIPHKVIPLSFFANLNQSSLIDTKKEVPTGDDVQMDDMETSLETAKSVWVPNRNGIFLNIGAGFAEALGAEYVVPGFNKEEAQTFPDNSEDYMQKLDASFSLSTFNGVKVKCYSSSMDKSEIIKDSLRLNVDFSLVWPCYFDGDKICKSCESCQRYLRALAANGVELYEV